MERNKGSEIVMRVDEIGYRKYILFKYEDRTVLKADLELWNHLAPSSKDELLRGMREWFG